MQLNTYRFGNADAIHMYLSTLFPNTSLQHSSPRLLYNTLSPTLLYNTLLQGFSTTLFSKASLQHSSPRLLCNTLLQHFSTRLFSNASLQQFPTTTFFRTLSARTSLQLSYPTLLHKVLLVLLVKVLWLWCFGGRVLVFWWWCSGDVLVAVGGLVFPCSCWFGLAGLLVLVFWCWWCFGISWQHQMSPNKISKNH